MKNQIKIELIDEYMKEHNLSKSAFCKKCNIGYAYLKKIYDDKTNFFTIGLVKIARVLGIELHQLFEDKKPL